MKLSVIEKTDELTILKLEGRLDLAGVQEVQMQFYQHTAARKKPTIIDMSDVSFLASLGIRMLIEAAKGLKAGGAKLILLKPQELVEKSLRSSGLVVVLGITHDLDAAKKLATT